MGQLCGTIIIASCWIFQVLDGRLIQGLVSLTYLNVRSNNIFKVEKGIVENCPSCRTLILTGKESLIMSAIDRTLTLIKNGFINGYRKKMIGAPWGSR